MDKIKKILLLGSTVLLLGACASTEEQEVDAEQLEEDIAMLKEEKTRLENIITETREEHGIERYYVSINVKQKHTILDLEKKIKDEFNDISIAFPVDREYYESVDVGTVIDDSFRKGSFFIEGSIGKWNITVDDKWIE